MNRPDFKEVGRLIRMLTDLGTAFEGIYEKTSQFENSLREACEARRIASAGESLSRISVEELPSAVRPSQIQSLRAAGFLSLRDLHQASDASILEVSGIGDKTLTALRTAEGEFLRLLAERERVILQPDAAETTIKGTGDSSRCPSDREIITLLFRLLQAEKVKADAQPLREELSSSIHQVIGHVTIRNRVRWFFSTKRTREENILAIADLIGFCRNPLCTRALSLVSAFRDAESADESAALPDFERNSASYYALLERFSGTSLPEELIYQSIPAQLASEIRAEEMDLAGFHGNLRSYQDFGARYILHQKKVLLGDEMGLGKTIQAIAAMSHLARKQPGCHFLIVCPASVTRNWCREVDKFSDIPVSLIHGETWEAALDHWMRCGGAGVTSYEGMDKIISRIDRVVSLALFVIDEAHYIKNPEAKRTKNIHRLYEESERILLMTGTPLENRVEEMCQLIGFVRPDLTAQIREKALFRNLPEFKELLSPVYLRRLRDQVLTELPPLTEEEEWCIMTGEDREAYLAQVQARQFMAMRRISYLQDDINTSSKALRLRELCETACIEGRKVIVFSYFRETITKVRGILGDLCGGVLTGSTPAADRQGLIDHFSGQAGGSVLLCQIQAGGIGLNLQAASVVIFCEPQIKPSLTRQALSRVYRMGQVRNVLVYHLLCENTVDEAMKRLNDEKQAEFDMFAEESALAEAADAMPDRAWIQSVIEQERQKYLPAIVTP